MFFFVVLYEVGTIKNTLTVMTDESDIRSLGSLVAWNDFPTFKHIGANAILPTRSYRVCGTFRIQHNKEYYHTIVYVCIVRGTLFCIEL